MRERGKRGRERGKEGKREGGRERGRERGSSWLAHQADFPLIWCYCRRLPKRAFPRYLWAAQPALRTGCQPRARVCALAPPTPLGHARKLTRLPIRTRAVTRPHDAARPKQCMSTARGVQQHMCRACRVSVVRATQIFDRTVADDKIGTDHKCGLAC